MLSRILKHRKRILGNQFQSKIIDLFPSFKIFLAEGDIYIDFYAGNDNNSGRTKDKPIKTHHRLLEIMNEMKNNGATRIVVSVIPRWYQVDFGVDYRDHTGWLPVLDIQETVYEFNGAIIDGTGYKFGARVIYMQNRNSSIIRKCYVKNCMIINTVGGAFATGFNTVAFPNYYQGDYDTAPCELHLENIKAFNRHVGYTNSYADKIIVEKEVEHYYSETSAFIYCNEIDYVNFKSKTIVPGVIFRRNSGGIYGSENVDTNGICTLDEFKSKYSSWFESAGEPVYVKIS